MQSRRRGGSTGVWAVGNGRFFAHAGSMTPANRLCIIEPGLPFGPDYLENLLFDSDGRRRVERIVAGSSARAGDRRSMKTEAFWKEVDSTFERFRQSGGEIVRT